MIKQLSKELKSSAATYFTVIIVVLAVGLLFAHKIDWFFILIFSITFFIANCIGAYLQMKKDRQNR